MGSLWAESVNRSLEQALDLLAAALGECPDALWETPMWPVEPLGRETQFFGADWELVIDAGRRDELARKWVDRRSTPWSVAWHALECFDYDLNGDFDPWVPPPPFNGHPHWRDLAALPAAWTQTELLGYVDYCRGRAAGLIASMTNERASAPLPQPHRYAGQPHAWLIAGIPVHTAEHAAQIRQFTIGAVPSGG